MKFQIDQSRKIQKVVSIYRADECSFDIEPCNIPGFTSLVIDTLQLEIDEEGALLYVWGYCPFFIYKETDKFPKNYDTFALKAELGEPPIPGIAIDVTDKEWPNFINKKHGWVCLGDPDTLGDQLIEFAPSCVAVLNQQEMRALWLRPSGLAFA